MQRKKSKGKITFQQNDKKTTCVFESFSSQVQGIQDEQKWKGCFNTPVSISIWS